MATSFKKPVRRARSMARRVGDRTLTNHLGKEQEKLAEGGERDFSDSRLITSPARCLLLHPVAMTLAMRLPLRHLCRSLSNKVLQCRT